MGADWRGDPCERDARGARSRAEQCLPRSLSRSRVRPVEGLVHLHGERARHDSRTAARPDGRDRARRLHGGGEARDRKALSRPETDLGSRAEAQPAPALRPDPAHDHPRVHARSRRAKPRAPARRRLSEGGDRDRAARRDEGLTRRRTAPRMARAAPVLGRGAEARRAPRCRNRARVHDGRRRRALHRGNRLPGAREADDHRSAGRRDAGVGPGGALLGSRATRPRSASRTRGSASTTSTSTFPPVQCRRMVHRPA